VRAAVMAIAHRRPMTLHHLRPRSKRLTLAARLDHEWDVVRSRPHVVARARSWRVTDAPFTDLGELLALAGHRTARTPEANAVLARLVDAARTDELASRVVIQRLLPALLAIVRRRASRNGLEELIGAAWLAIRTYRTDRRPERIAANLVHDAEYAAFIAPSRRRMASEIPIDPQLFDETPAEIVLASCEELANLLAEARREGIPDEDVDLVRHLVRVGSPAIVAAECNVTARTVRNRRDRMTARLREVAFAAA
jgi:hypothetical protein